MSITINKILAAAPATVRGQPTQLSCDSKGERIAYAVSHASSPFPIRGEGGISANARPELIVLLTVVRQIHLPEIHRQSRRE